MRCLVLGRQHSGALAAKYRVIALRSSGPWRAATVLKSTTRWSTLARGVDAVLNDAGVEQAVLVGHSMGVLVIRQYLVRSQG